MMKERRCFGDEKGKKGRRKIAWDGGRIVREGKMVSGWGKWFQDDESGYRV
jgi:hypothetical protein